MRNLLTVNTSMANVYTDFSLNLPSYSLTIKKSKCKTL